MKSLIKNIILIFAAILGGNMEQASLVMLCFGLATNIYVFIRDKKIKLDLIIFNLFILINTAILFLAPGNYARSASEKLTWFGEWDMISFTTKLMMGTNLLLNQLFNKEVMLMLLLIFLINIVVWKKYKNILFKALSAIPMIIIIIKLIEKVCYIFNFNINLFLFNLLNVQNLNILNFNNIKIFLPTSILLCALLIVPILFLFVFDTLEMRYLSIILYVAAICSALSISVSPTIYVSGARVFFVADILLIVIITLILSEFFKRWNVNIYLILLFIILSINSFILYIRKIL